MVGSKYRRMPKPGNVFERYEDPNGNIIELHTAAVWGKYFIVERSGSGLRDLEQIDYTRKFLVSVRAKRVFFDEDLFNDFVKEVRF